MKKKKLFGVNYAFYQIPGQTLNFKMEFAMPVDIEK